MEDTHCIDGRHYILPDLRKMPVPRQPGRDFVIEVLTPFCCLDIAASDTKTESNAWFWSEEWQAGEREADEDISNGRYKKFTTVNELLGYLDGLEEEESR